MEALRNPTTIPIIKITIADYHKLQSIRKQVSTFYKQANAFVMGSCTVIEAQSGKCEPMVHILVADAKYGAKHIYINWCKR
ncbi:hypothetical protein NIES4071_91600 [Calothrix sp. NIES-4071]|nr:hypothetical protein NIES4071_91600 [Calothrix sp. NIES-4071]BAZ63427.1 hypothetical protein NIES4105_91530 [Calothrix sp. NIES-4105]